MIKKKITSLLSAAAIVLTSVPAMAITTNVQTPMTAFAEESYTVPDLSIKNKAIPDTDSFRFVNSMGAGFCLGNTFDATNNKHEWWYANERKLLV